MASRAAASTRLIELIGLESVAKKARRPVFSLAWANGFGIASALLATGVVMLDEPVNGLDPDGIRWIRDLMKTLAAEGRTGLPVVASDDRDGDDGGPPDRDRRRTPDCRRLVDEFIRRTPSASSSSAHRRPLTRRARRGPRRNDRSSSARLLEIEGLTAEQIGTTAASNDIVLYELTPRQASLEEAFMVLTRDEVEFQPAHPPLTNLKEPSQHERHRHTPNPHDATHTGRAPRCASRCRSGRSFARFARRATRCSPGSR